MQMKTRTVKWPTTRSNGCCRWSTSTWTSNTRAVCSRWETWFVFSLFGLSNVSTNPESSSVWLACLHFPMVTWISVCVQFVVKSSLFVQQISTRQFKVLLTININGITSCCVSALLQQSLVFMLSFHTAKILKRFLNKNHVVSGVFSLLCALALWQVPRRPPGSQWDRRVLQGAHATTRAGESVQTLLQQRLCAFYRRAARLPGRPARGRLAESRSKSHTHLRVQRLG